MSFAAGFLLSRAAPHRVTAPGRSFMSRNFASHRAPTPMLLTAQSPYDSKKAVNFLQSLHDLNLDVIQSRHTILGNHSCFNLLVNAPGHLSVEDVSGSLRKKFPDMEFAGQSDVSPFLEAAEKSYTALDVLGMGVERKGVVPALFNLWDHFGIQVRSFDSVTSDDGFRGVRMLQMRATLAIPSETDIDRVNEALNQFQEDYGLIVTVDQSMAEGEQQGVEQDDYSEYTEEDYDERGPHSHRDSPPGAYVR